MDRWIKELTSHFAIVRPGVTFIDVINVNFNVNNNEMVFFAHDQVLIKLLRQGKGFDAKKFITEFPSKP